MTTGLAHFLPKYWEQNSARQCSQSYGHELMGLRHFFSWGKIFSAKSQEYHEVFAFLGAPTPNSVQIPTGPDIKSTFISLLRTELILNCVNGP